MMILWVLTAGFNPLASSGSACSIASVLSKQCPDGVGDCP